MWWILFASVVAILLLWWFLALTSTIKAKAALNTLGLPNNRKTSFLLVTAHPDDECMFFSPSILCLAELGQMHCLCFSNGNAEGLGKVREKELRNSCQVLGISSQRVAVLNNNKLQDSMSLDWDSNEIGIELQKYLKRTPIDLVITFDHLGVSGHTNHRALYTAIQRQLESRQIDLPCFQLTTVSVPRKFSSLLDLVTTSLLYAIRLASSNVPSGYLMLVVSPFGYYRGRLAMFKHYSQLVWFRHLYLIFSRYMVINDLQLITPTNK